MSSEFNDITRAAAQARVDMVIQRYQPKHRSRPASECSLIDELQSSESVRGASKRAGERWDP